jgi:hypothetical protein
VAGSQGIIRAVDRSTRAWRSGYPVCQPVTRALSYSSSARSQPKTTSQKPRPPRATEANLSRLTYLPRRTPSRSTPAIFTWAAPFSSSQRSASPAGSAFPRTCFGARMDDRRVTRAPVRGIAQTSGSCVQTVFSCV